MLTRFRADDVSLQACLEQRQSFHVDDGTTDAVRSILNAVRQSGDAALRDLTARFDGVEMPAERLRVSASEIRGAVVSRDLLGALERAAGRIRAFHERELRNDWWQLGSEGGALGQRYVALDSVGIYIPGGQAPYASSLLMNAIPAALAGVRRIVAVTPPAPDGSVHPLILAAASICDVTEIYRVGGAQAIGALAYGTETVDPVRKIVGPGNAYVTEAKRLVFGTVGIDALAGPSEVAIVADDTTDPRWIAADLLAQAEHDSDAFCVLISTSERILDEVDAELEEQTQRLARQETLRAAMSNSLAIQTGGMNDTLEIVERIAPEHLQLLVARPLEWVPRIRSAGVVLCGPYAPAPVCDYGIGPNHVLPTGGSARFASALGVDDFLRRLSVVFPSAEAFAAIQADCIQIANAESLTAHAASLRVRGGAR